VTDRPLVVFTPSGKRGRFAHGTTLLQAARALGVDVDSVCGGRGLCGRCQIRIAEGEFAKHGIRSERGHVSASGEVEARYRARKGMAEEHRLSCQARILGDVVVDVPAESQVHRQVVRKRAEVRTIALDPIVRLHYLEVAPPDMHAQRGDLERLQEALAAQWQIGALPCDLAVLQGLQHALRAGEWKVTVAVHAGACLIGIWPGFVDRVFGLAIDVGSTTIAGHLCDLHSGEVLASGGLMNPQIRFGEDLMSRVSYAMMNPGGVGEMTVAVREALCALIAQVTDEAGVDPSELLALTAVGNPIMHHLLLGIDPRELGTAPFALASDRALTLRASELELTAHPGARIYFLPCIAGHVGADTAGVVLSETPHLADEMTLIVDIGTNAEIVLGNRHRLLAASSPTGPAFEGAQISCGQRAAPGAIERVRIDRETLEPRFKVIGCDLWSDQPGFAEATARTGVTGICGSGIIEVLAEMFLAGILRADGTIDGDKAMVNARVQPDGRTHAYLLHAGEPEIRILQTDVRAIQLAKAALYAGARLLMDHLGIDRVDRITLAGAFGSQIDVTYAMVLGLIPDCDLAKVASAGNAAGTGARIALLNQAARTEIEQVVKRIEKIETAIEPRFQEHFVAAMAIPHKSAPFPHLARAVALPTPAPATIVPRRRRR
jgi:uncharacterized 2Fe-2S/4Fe-4S cluster protein (DUF4445 family)